MQPLNRSDWEWGSGVLFMPLGKDFDLLVNSWGSGCLRLHLILITSVHQCSALWNEDRRLPLEKSLWDVIHEVNLSVGGKKYTNLFISCFDTDFSLCG